MKSLTSFLQRSPAFFSTLLFLGLSAVGMAVKPLAFQRYFELQTRVFDVDQYLHIALVGYSDPAKPAFAPLWPLMVRLIHALGVNENLVLVASVLSLILFVCSIFVLEKFLKKIFSSSVTAIVILLYALNPNSLFHALAYAESLFALLCSIYLLCGWNYLNSNISRTKAWHLLVFCFLMGFTRPIFLQFTLALSIACLLISHFQKKSLLTEIPRAKLVRFWGASVTGVTLAMVAFGVFCQQTFGNFWQPFDAQTYWDRKFGFYWQLIVSPKSVSESDNVLNWDLQAFYLPVLAVFYFAWRAFGKRNVVLGQDLHSTSRAQSATTLLLWMCALFAAAHAAIAFFSYPIFMSIGRHVFSIPPFFIVVGAALTLVTKEKTRNRLGTFYVVYSAAFFVYWWSRYAREGWLG